jgi:hypothetical protein
MSETKFVEFNSISCYSLFGSIICTYGHFVRIPVRFDIAVSVSRGLGTGCGGEYLYLRMRK